MSDKKGKNRVKVLANFLISKCARAFIVKQGFCLLDTKDLFKLSL